VEHQEALQVCEGKVSNKDSVEVQKDDKPLPTNGGGLSFNLIGVG
jgi:hypothetical protein